MKKLFLTLLITSICLTGFAQDKKSENKSKDKAKETKEYKPTNVEVLYSIGYFIGENLKKQLVLKDEEMSFKSIFQGVKDAFLSKPSQVDLEIIKPYVRERYMQDKEIINEKRKKEQLEYVKQAKEKASKKNKEEAIVLDNDVIIEISEQGSGKKPTAEDTVKVHYEGKLTDGTIFDSSKKRNMPAEFPLSGVIPCWTTAFQQLKVGAKARLTCPSDTAYGPSQMGPIPPNSTLIFEVEFLDIIEK